MSWLPSTVIMLMLMAALVNTGRIIRLYPDVCPRDCRHPRSAKECADCLKHGFNDVVDGHWKWTGKYERLRKKLVHGAWSEWKDNRCWIRVIGAASLAECHAIGADIFGNRRCLGFHDMITNIDGQKCWARFEPLFDYTKMRNRFQ